MPPSPSRLSLLLLASATTTLISSASASSSSFSRAPRWVGRVRGGAAGAENVESSSSQIPPGLDKKDFTLLEEADLYRGKWYVAK